LCINPNGNISCCGTNGSVFMSDDEGETWTEIGLQSENTINRMYWKTENECYLVVMYEGFYRSTDMGQNWSLAINSTFAENNDIFFVNENRGLALRDYAVFTTDDGGNNWIDATTQMNIAEELYATVVLSEDHFVSTSIGEGGVIQETFDGGYNWERIFEHPQVMGFTNIVKGPDSSLFFGSTGSGIFYRNQNMEIISATVNLSDEEGDEVNVFAGPNNTLFAYLEPYPTNISQFNMIIKSDDLGEKWYEADFPLDRIEDLKFDNQNLITIGFGIRISNDGGNTWKQPSLPSFSTPMRISMPSSDKYFLLCKNYTSEGGAVLSSVDAGNNWQVSASGLPETDFEGIAISFPDAQTGYVLGNDGNSIKLYKTANAGEQWELISAPSLQNATSMAWLNAETGFICSSYFYAPGLFKTTDGGLTWTMISDERFSEVVGKDASAVIAFNRHGSSTAFYESVDGGESFDWVATPFDDGDYSQYQNPINGICSAVSTEDGWIFGGCGSKIIKASATITAVAEEINVHQKNSIEIISVNPNPTTNNSIIEFIINKDSRVNIITYDLRGVVVQELKTQLFTKGKHKLMWDGRGLPIGCYFVRVQTDTGNSTWKIVKQ